MKKGMTWLIKKEIDQWLLLYKEEAQLIFMT